MKFFLKKISFFLIISFYTAVVKPNEDEVKPSFKFEYYSLEKGLSQSNVMCILQDKNGFIWLGTEDGLNRFDGYNFIVYKNSVEDTNSISHNYIYSLAEDKDGNIWIATALGGICKYNPYQNTFKRYIKDRKNVSLTSVLSIFVDSENNVWAGTYLVGLSKYNRHDDYFDSFIFDKNNSTSIPSSTINTIYENKNGLWLGSSDAGLILFDEKKSEFKSYTTKDGLPSNHIKSICSNKKGELVIGTSNGLSIFNFSNFKNYFHSNNLNSLSSNRIKTVFTDNEGNLFVGTEDAGLNFLPSGSNNFYRYTKEDNNTFCISDNYILSFYQDFSGIIWIGTGRGLNKIKKEKKFDILLGPDSKGNLSGKTIWSVLEDKKNIWAGTSQGIFGIKKSKSYKDYTPIKNLEGKVVNALVHDDETIWIGTSTGLINYNKQSGEVSFYYNNVDNDSYYFNLIKSLYLEEDTLWIGTYARGIIKFDIKKKEFFPFNPSKGNTNLLNNFVVFKIYQDTKGDFWFCTSVGLYQYKPGSDELIHSFSTYDEKSGKNIRLFNQSLTILEYGNNFWVGTSGGGLVKFIPGKGIVKRYTENEGLSNNIVYAILPDDSGSLWLSTNKGISRFNILNENFKNFDFNDGLPSDEFNVGASLKSSSGKLYFGGKNGLVSFYPGEIKSNTFIPPVKITGLKIFDKLYLNKNFIANAETIELPYSDNFLSIDFSAMDFTTPDKNQYAYMLEGFDKNWNYVYNRHFASYTNISPGDYIFKVKGSNSDGIWNNAGTYLRIIINPPFYRTWLAYTLYAVAFIASLLTLRQYEINKRKKKTEQSLKEERERGRLREAQLRAEKAELQAKAVETEKEIEKQQIRNRIAADLHDEIGSNLSSIILLSSLIKNNLPDDEKIKYISDINNAARISSEAIREIIWFINPLSDNLDKLILKMKETANIMLTGLNLRFISSGINLKSINPDIKRNIYLIYKEILNNILKHSRASEVEIKIAIESGYFFLLVCDNGTGFDFSGKRVAACGNGLLNMEERAKNIEGEIEIDSSPGKGTTIKLKVKLA